ncbi:MAG: ABC transporter substrate-binding protein [Candidatus Lustribacter sp.]|jgi:branched-chain amino acid transport system substrate-binding protein
MNDNPMKSRGRLTRAALVAVALAGSLCVHPRPISAAASGPPIEIYAILTTSGNGAFFGQAEANALKVAEPRINAAGGIGGRPVHFVVLDDQGNPATTVQLVSDLIVKKVSLFLGPGTPAACFAATPLIDKAGPVAMCLNPSGHPSPGSYLFDPYADSTEVASAILRYFRERGITRIALLNATDASGRDADRAFAYAFRLPENRNLVDVADEHYNTSDITVAAQLSRIKAAAPQAVVSFQSGSPLGTVLHGLHDAGMDVPVATSGGNMTYGQMQAYAGFLPTDMLFSGTIAWVPGDIGPGPIRDAQLAYVAALKSAGMRPEAGAVTVWDPALIAVDVLRAVGPHAEAGNVRAYLANLHGWVGAQGVYDFKSYPQHGVGANAEIVMRWDAANGTFVPASRRGGALRK